VSSLFFVRLKAGGGQDYPAAMNHALTYQLFAFTAILIILGLRRWTMGPPRPGKNPPADTPLAE